MKKVVLIAFCLLSIVSVSTVYANPWLVCDPMTLEVIRIDLDLNGQLINVETATMRKEADAWYLLDLGTIQGGSYTVKAKADYGTWGESDFSVPFDFVKPALDSPANVNIKF